MKKITFFFLIFCFFSIAQATALKHAISYTEAIQKGIEEKKHLIIYTHAPNCSWCTKMEEETLSEQKVISLLNEKYIFLSLDVTSYDQVKDVPSQFVPQGTPTTFIIDPTTKELLYVMRGYRSPKSFLFRITK